MTNTLYLPELREMLAANDVAGLEEFCTALHHPARTAEFVEGLTAEEAWVVLQHAELPLRVEIFRQMAEEIELRLPGASYYLCMEPESVWRRALGHAPSPDDILKDTIKWKSK